MKRNNLMEEKMFKVIPAQKKIGKKYKSENRSELGEQTEPVQNLSDKTDFISMDTD